LNSRVLGLAALLLSSGPATAQVAIVQIGIVEGEGAVHVPGSRSARPLVVEVTDETGKPVAGAAVTFLLPENGPGGIFANGLRTDVAITDSRGRGAAHTLQLNRTAGRFQIRIVASKEQARAGTVSFQYIGEAKGGAVKEGAAKGEGTAARTAPVATSPTSSGSSARRRKWVAVAAALGGGAVLGILASRGSASAATPAPPVPVTPTLTIGTPSITVGKP
jgi:hypothetical protein